MLPLLWLFFACVAPGVWAQSPRVTIGGTTFTGTSKVSNVTRFDFFGGIPFAEPPIGDLRFAPPVLKDTYDNAALDATEYGATCAQIVASSNTTTAPMSEDCLTLNVFRPSGISHTANLPVFVYLYGGAFSGGDTASLNPGVMMNRSMMRDTPFMFVSINYRVGVFGFPQGAEARERGALNLGLKDQLVGLQWVNKYITAFGGNPQRVTLGGVSAGAMSASYLYFNSGLENLVHGAIFESGSPGSLPWFPPEQRQSAWDLLVGNVSTCTDSDVMEENTFRCLRAATTDQLLSAALNAITVMPLHVLLSFSPVLDGPDGVMPGLPSSLSAQGQFARIPFISGTTLDEGTGFVPQDISSGLEILIALAAQMQEGLPSLAFAADVERMLELFPDDPAVGSPYGTGRQTFGLSSEYKRASAIVGDLLFQAPRRRWMEIASAAGVPSWGYHFVDQSAVQVPRIGVGHGSDVEYFFGYKAVNDGVGADVQLLSTAMLDYWLSFVTSGTPNDMKGVSRTMWPQYTTENKVLIQFDRSNFTSPLGRAGFSVVTDNYHEEQISFINSIQADLNE